MTYIPDEIDQQIMRLLQHHARMPIAQIGKEINMSQPSVKERITKLEEKGIISGYSTIYDLAKLNRGTTTFILFKTERCEELVHFCEQAPEVTDLHRISGEYNYLIKVRTTSIEELASFQDALVKLGTSKSHISMKTIMENRVLL
ncbi:Lrp/AsnC family transcriptional regulator [Paenibacillus illinoisensis]|uniref:Lrp/AsnC family transcriptional regulator n=1 Tax=Paenibacillus illinoisensis TaxID=59845 RepID=UPI001C8DD262|nr:Lrp/AsnC family transcriptional regulator [Paenibacillus illinoisensis]MBY0217680.1 Lrp/AsnC family transcriptional regulator [Paenibacillus illinoisensis]